MPTLTEQIIQRLTGFDLFIERDDPRCGFLDFDVRHHPSGAMELWGFGLHLIIDRV